MSGKRKDRCNHCGSIVKIGLLQGRQRHEAQLKVEMKFRTAHKEVFMNCGEYPDMPV